MKNLIQFLLVILLILSLFACSNQNASVFEGESDNWIISYYLNNGESENAYDYEIHVQYKGNIDSLLNLSHIGLNLLVGTNNLGGDIPVMLLDTDEKIIFKSSGSYEGANIPDKNSNLMATIKWGNDEENLKLAVIK